MKNYKDFKVVICGSHGAGKTTLMTDWSEKHGVPIARFASRDHMPEGTKTHQDILRLAANEPERGIAFQELLIKNRYELFRNFGSGFVSDRSVFDSLAYYSMHNAPFNADIEKDNELSQLASDSLRLSDLLVMIAPRLEKAEDDGMRVSSPAYYAAYAATLSSQVRAALAMYNQNYPITNQTIAVYGCTADLITVGNLFSVLVLNEANTAAGIFSREARIALIETALDVLARKDNND